MDANSNQAQVGDSQVFNFDQNSTEGDIRTVVTPITVDLIKDHLSSKDKKQAQIRCEVEKYYPSTSIGNSHSDTIFQKEEFGIPENPDPYVEKRVTWIDVPKDSTVESVAERLSQFPNARIYKVLSLEPIITDQQMRAMQSGISFYADEDGVAQPVTMEYYMNKQRVKESEEGDYIDYQGLPQYRQLFFSSVKKEDIDFRPEQFAKLNTSQDANPLQITDVQSKEEIRAEAARAAQEFA